MKSLLVGIFIGISHVVDSLFTCLLIDEYERLGHPNPVSLEKNWWRYLFQRYGHWETNLFKLPFTAVLFGFIGGWLWDGGAKFMVGVMLGVLGHQALLNVIKYQNVKSQSESKSEAMREAYQKISKEEV
jgi:hypothetical protein